MFPMPPPRPPRPPFPPGPPGRPGPMQGKQHSKVTNILGQFQDDKGQIDFDKVSKVANQMGKLYGQVSPLLSKFTKK